MTKEEILDKSITYAFECDDASMVIPYGAAEKAMDEYAKQQAIAFDEWKVSNKYRASLNMFGELVYEDDSDHCYGTQELYNQFIEQQNKP